MRFSLQKIISPSIPLAALLLVSCGVLWILPVQLPSFATTTAQLPLSRFLQGFFTPENIVTIPLCLLITLLNSILLYQLNNVFTLIREKTFLLILVFFLLASSFPTIHYNLSANLGLTLTLTAFFRFLDMYHSSIQTESAFLGSLLVACCGWLLFPEFLLLFVPVWIAFVMLKAFSLRVFLASLIGLVSPSVFCFVFAPNYADIFLDILPTVSENWKNLLEHQINVHFIIIWILLIFWILAMFGFFSNTLRDSSRTRTNINLILLFFVSVVVITVLFPQIFYIFLPLLLALFTVFFSHPITLKDSQFYTILFLVFCAIIVLYNGIQLVITMVL